MSWSDLKSLVLTNNAGFRLCKFAGMCPRPLLAEPSYSEGVGAVKEPSASPGASTNQSVPEKKKKKGLWVPWAPKAGTGLRHKKPGATKRTQVHTNVRKKKASYSKRVPTGGAGRASTFSPIYRAKLQHKHTAGEVQQQLLQRRVKDSARHAARVL